MSIVGTLWLWLWLCNSATWHIKLKYTVNSVSISPCSPVMDVLTLLFLSTRLYWWSLIMQIKSFCNSEKKCYWHSSVVDSIVCSLRMSLSVLDPFVTYVVSLETLCLHYVSLVDHIMGSHLKSQNHQTVSEWWAKYKTRDVLILDMVPTEICLEVEVPYVGPNDGER